MKQPRELTSLHVRRNGALLAVLRVVDHGHVFKVVAELFGEGSNGAPANVRPYTFRNHVDASAFVDDARGTFTHLGCEIRQS